MSGVPVPDGCLPPAEGAFRPRDHAWMFALGLALIAAIYLGQSLYLARLLIPSHDQTSSLFIGYRQRTHQPVPR